MFIFSSEKRYVWLAGIAVDVGASVGTLRKGDHVIALDAGMPAVRVQPVTQDKSAPSDPLYATQRPDAWCHVGFFH
jgi:hypothetical protein